MYTWNEEKNRLNKQKHGFFFSEITDIFDDPYLLEFYDAGHSWIEDRYICIGCMHDTVFISAVTTDKIDGNTQVISARKAAPKEKEAYYENYRRETGGN